MLKHQFEMDGLYGLMIPFAFCQGPGQSVAFGTIKHQYFHYK